MFEESGIPTTRKRLTEAFAQSVAKLNSYVVST